MPSQHTAYKQIDDYVVFSWHIICKKQKRKREFVVEIEGSMLIKIIELWEHTKTHGE